MNDAREGAGTEATAAAGAPVASSSARERAGVWACILVPALVAIVLCSIDITGRSIWIDESATIAITGQHGAALVAAIKRDGGNMLAYYLLLHVLEAAFGNGLLVLRLPSALADGVTAGAVAAVGIRLFSRRVGLAGGLLAAVSLPLVYWGQDARAYSMMFAFGSLSYLGFVALVDGESNERPGRPPRWAWPLYAGALVLATYMSLVALLVVPAQLVSLWWNRRRLRQVAAALAVTAVVAVPLAVIAHERGSGQLFWVPRPSLHDAAGILQAVMSSGFAPDVRNSASSIVLLAITLALLVAAALLAVRTMRTGPIVAGSSRCRWRAVVVGAWLLVPAVLDVAESLVGQSIYESRYLLISAPAVGLALAWVLLETNLPRIGAWALVAGLIALRGWQIIPSYGVSNEDWRGASEYVLAHDRPGDCVVFYPSDARQAVDYYFKASGRAETALPRPMLPSAPFGQVKAYVEDYATLSDAQASSTVAACPRLWIVSSHTGVPNGTPASRAHYARYEALVARLEGGYGHHDLRRFGYASQVDVRLLSGRGA